MRVSQLEPIVERCLVSDERCRKDDFILYLSVIEQYGLDTTMSIHSVLNNHSLLKLPSFESVSRCRRKIQERDVSLKDSATARMREEARQDYSDYAVSDKVWY